MPLQEVEHPQLGRGRLIRTYMGGHEWEVEFVSGRRFRLPSNEFERESVETWQGQSAGTLPLPAQRVAPEPDQFRARQTLETLRFGIVPVQDVETLTIGLEAESVSLNRALARAREHGGDVMAVVGDYGFGKSHFIELAARRALRDNFMVMVASLDLIETPPSKSREIYRALVASTRYPDTPARGLRPLFERFLDAGALSTRFANQSLLGDQDPLAGALEALQSSPTQSVFDDLLLWISGQAKPSPDLRLSYRKPPTLYATGETARQYAYLLTGLSNLALLMGYSGLAILIDESEHYSLLRASQRVRADSFFKALIYGALNSNSGRIEPTGIPQHSRASYPVSFTDASHLFFLFALTESENRMPFEQWLTPSQVVRLDDRFIEKDIRKFFTTLRDYHGLAYGYTPNGKRHAELVDTAPGLLSQTLSQHRINLRELIRASVALYDLLYLYDDYDPVDLLHELADGLGL
jgi:hypothetical protein